MNDKVNTLGTPGFGAVGSSWDPVYPPGNNGPAGYVNLDSAMKSMASAAANWSLPDYDGSASPVGATGTTEKKIPYKYAEDRIISDFKAYIDKTYSEHYKTDQHSVECFDAWIALGESVPTFRNTAIKYLWRYGKKGGSNKADLMKTLHYVLMCLYVDHYKDGK